MLRAGRTDREFFDHLGGGAIRVESTDGGAHRMLAGVDVGPRTDTQVQLFTLSVEKQRARDMAASEIFQRDDFLTTAAYRAGLRIVGIAFNRGCLGDIEPLVLERETVGPVEAGDKSRFLAVAYNVHRAVFDIGYE